ncbi:tetratricopeptide repeat protein, partial [bacterium]|nr:tetratricopeptide repeat protein [bacterium]
LVRRGELAEAEQWVQKLAERAGETFAAVELRARVLKAKGRSDAAAKLIRDFAAAGGARATLPAAALLDTLDMTADAEGLYRAYAADSKEPSAPLALAGFLARRGRLSEAMPLYEAAWKAGPPEAVGRSSVAALRAGRGSPADAGRVEAWIDAAVAAAPQSVGLLVLKADLYQFQERFADAVAVYREVLRRDPRQVVALNNLAYLLAVRGGRPDEALALIDAGLAVTGPHPDLLDTRGVVLTRAGRADEAAADLARAVADAPAGEKHFHLALAHLRAGRKAAAATGLRDATEAGLRRDDLHPLERPEWDRLSAELARP